MGLISAKFNIEGPILSEKTTFSLSGRRTYADLLLKPILLAAMSNNDGLEKASAGYYFYDLNAKVSHKFSDNDRFYLSAYLGDDVIYANFQQKATPTDNSWLKMNWNWGNLISAQRFL